MLFCILYSLYGVAGEKIGLSHQNIYVELKFMSKAYRTLDILRLEQRVFNVWCSLQRSRSLQALFTLYMEYSDWSYTLHSVDSIFNYFILIIIGYSFQFFFLF